MSEIEIGERKKVEGEGGRVRGKWGRECFTGLAGIAVLREVELVQRGHVEWKKTKDRTLGSISDYQGEQKDRDPEEQAVTRRREEAGECGCPQVISKEERLLRKREWPSLLEAK